MTVKDKFPNTPWSVVEDGFGGWRVHDCEGRLKAQAATAEVAALIAVSPEMLGSFQSLINELSHAIHYHREGRVPEGGIRDHEMMLNIAQALLANLERQVKV